MRHVLILLGFLFCIVWLAALRVSHCTSLVLRVAVFALLMFVLLLLCPVLLVGFSRRHCESPSSW